MKAGSITLSSSRYRECASQRLPGGRQPSQHYGSCSTPAVLFDAAGFFWSRSSRSGCRLHRSRIQAQKGGSRRGSAIAEGVRDEPPPCARWIRERQRHHNRQARESTLSTSNRGRITRTQSNPRLRHRQNHGLVRGARSFALSIRRDSIEWSARARHARPPERFARERECRPKWWLEWCPEWRSIRRVRSRLGQRIRVANGRRRCGWKRTKLAAFAGPRRIACWTDGGKSRLTREPSRSFRHCE